MSRIKVDLLLSLFKLIFIQNDKTFKSYIFKNINLL